jgi:hypothetical protein
MCQKCNIGVPLRRNPGCFCIVIVHKWCESITSNWEPVVVTNGSSTTRRLSMNHPQAMSLMIDKSPTSTSPLVVGYTRRQNGSNLMTMAPSLVTSVPKAQTNSPTSSTSMLPPTTASIHLSPLYLGGFATYSPDQEATSTFSKPLWPRLTTGAWQGKSRGTGKSTTTLPTLQSRSRSISRTLRQHGPNLHRVSPASCSPRLQSMLRHFIMCRGR